MHRQIFICALLSLFTFLLPPQQSKAQLCSGAIFSDDFSNPALWQAMGTKVFTWGSPGDVAVTGGATRYDQFRGRQTYRLVRSLNGALQNEQDWRMEFDFVLNATTPLSGVVLMAVTENDQHPQTAASGSIVPNNNSGIQIVAANPLGSNMTGDRISITAKIGTTNAGGSATININRGVRYYVRLERLSARDWSLSLFTDAMRSVQIAGSPVCLQTNDPMGSLHYLQQGTGTTASPSRRMHGDTDNLCIFSDVMNKSCLPHYPCDINASVQYTTDGKCFFQFYNNSSAGTGNTLFGYSIITFGDGTSAQLAPGQIISHTYAFGGTYQVCIRAVGHNNNLECCEDEACITVEANCLGGFGFGKAAPTLPPSLEVFPNPSSDKVSVRSDKQVRNVRVFDQFGRQIRNEKGRGMEMQIELGELPSGSYIIEVELEENEVIRRSISIQQ